MLCDIKKYFFIDTIVMHPAGDPIIQTLKFLMDQDLHNL